MKKVFGFTVVFAMLMIATIFTGCSVPYTGKYFNVQCVQEVTQDEYDVYAAIPDENGGEKLAEFLRLAKEKSDNHISKVNLKDTELVSFLRNNNISEEDAQEIIDFLNIKVPVGNGFLTSFNYKIGEEMLHDIYFFQVSK